jgi:hypothetical protein
LPSLIDLHPSLANRNYLHMLIQNTKHERFPKGTRWSGVLILVIYKLGHTTTDISHSRLALHESGAGQDASTDKIYIHCALEYRNLDLNNPADLKELLSDLSGAVFRVFICMLLQASHKLLLLQYLQSNIAFKQVVGFEKFELGTLDLASQTSQYIL